MQLPLFSVNQVRTALWLTLGLAGITLQSCKEPLEEAAQDAKPAPAGQPQVMAEVAFPGKTGIRKQGKLFGTAITYEEIDGQAVFEGDIILSKAQLAESAPNGRTDAASRSLLEWRWPDNTVYYTIDPALPDKYRVTDAIAHWEANTNLRFVQDATKPNYITFIPGAGCYSSVGMQDVPQFITLGPDCTMGNTMHEIGHAVGLFHEHSRQDRDQFIVVHFNNIQEDKQYAYEKYTQVFGSGLDHGVFDFGSVMMYGRYVNSDFAIDPYKPVISRVDGSHYTAQRDELSDGDIACVNDLYPLKFRQVSGAWTDVGVGPNGSVCALSRAWMGGGHPVHQYQGGLSWKTLYGQAAIDMDVDQNGNPWIVNPDHNIFRWTGSQWVQVPGKARRIGIGSWGHVFVIGAGSATTGNVFQLNSDGVSWTNLQGNAERIDVDPNGIAWIVDASNNIFRRHNNQWQSVPGKAQDIGIGANSDVYVVGINAVPGGFGLYKWTGSGWMRQPRGVVRVSAGYKGHPWVIDNDGFIFRRDPVKLKLPL